MKAPRFSLRSLLFFVVAIALFLPQYPFLERRDGVDPLSEAFFYVDYDNWNRRPGPDAPTPEFVPFPPDVFVKRAVWQTATAELAAIAGWLLLRRLEGSAIEACGDCPMTATRRRWFHDLEEKRNCERGRPRCEGP